MTTLAVRSLNPEAFSPYGDVLGRPGRLHDAEGPGWRWWGETQTLAPAGRPYAVGYLDLQPAPHRFDWAERHMRSPETIVPLSGDCLVYVGPPDDRGDPGRMPPVERFEVFRVAAGQGVVLSPGVWHGAPLAVDRPLQAMVLLAEGTGAGDTTVVRFGDDPVEIDV
jgi:ureidoglycolate hydrolase